MKQLGEALSHLTFERTLRAFPFLYTLHLAEQWNMSAWIRRSFVDPPPITDLAMRALIILFGVLAFLWTVLAALPKDRSITAFVLLPWAAIVFHDGLKHTYWALHFSAYVPGLVSAWLVLLPVPTLLAVTALRSQLIPRWYIGTLLALIVIPLTIVAASAGDALDPVSRSAMEFSIALAALL
jgi:hypothetical protein